ncbi:MAG: response regulator [Clostridiales Family XIII bacterium]|jgi:putative two-component system response regulator|nr:response regulator [Clostridiales Family XIII bacterium]
MEMTKYKVIIVDDNEANLKIARSMLKEYYEVYPASSGARLFELMERILPDLILLDIEMPGMDGYDVIKKLKSESSFKTIPVIFLTAKTDQDSEIEGLGLGAIDYILKPFSAPLLRRRIENHILIAEQRKEIQSHNDYLKMEVDRKSFQVEALQNTMLMAVTEMVEFRDGNTGGHIDRTQRYLKVLLEEIMKEGIYADITKDWDVNLIVASSPLHDVGKIAIADAILNKPGKLTEEEFEVMKKHVDYGVEAISRIEKYSNDYQFLHFSKTIAATHHEKWNGTGYPSGLAGDEIPLEGRLMAIADVYDALISVRPYKKPLTTEVAESIINDGRGTHFDPVLVDVFNNVADKFAEIADSIDWGKVE